MFILTELRTILIVPKMYGSMTKTKLESVIIEKIVFSNKLCDASLQCWRDLKHRQEACGVTCDVIGGGK